MVGKLMESSLQFSFDSVNDQVAGRQIQVVVGDGQMSDSASLDVARKMVEVDHVAAIFGPDEQNEKVAVAGYLQQAGIPLMLYTPTPVSLLSGNQWVVGCEGSDVIDGNCMADYLFNQLHYKTIDTLTQDNESGRDFLNPLMSYFTQLGGQVVQSQWVPVPCPDFAPYLTTLKTADAFVAWESGSDAIQLLTQYHELGIDKKMPFTGAFHGGFLDSFIIDALPPADAAAAVGIPCPMTYAPDSQSDANQTFVKAFTAKMGFPPGDDTASGPYQAAMIFIAALNATQGDTTPNTLLNAIIGTSINGPEGPVSFTPEMHSAIKNVYILQVAQVQFPNATPNAPNLYAFKTVYTYPNIPPSGVLPK
jgi:ABC-type branched-subunit amino acid transport system substrate-binding protein